MRLAAFMLAVVGLLLPLATPAAGHTGQVFTYEVHARGDVQTDMTAFANQVAATLDDLQGWALGGGIELRRVADDGDFNVVLATPEEVGVAHPVCSWEWSCRVEDDVLINELRWNHGADGFDLPLSIYRRYLVNHEVGHWLGLDHASCPFPGAPAPVMMQQSKGLAGCTASEWPRASEQRAVADRHGTHVHRARVPGTSWFEQWVREWGLPALAALRHLR